MGKSGILNKKVWSSDAKVKALKSELITSVAATALGNEIVINDTDFEARFDDNFGLLSDCGNKMTGLISRLYST